MPKLNLGSNDLHFKDFLNLDHRAVDGVDIVDDAFTLKTFKDNTVDEIIASHILEHASFDRTQDVLGRWYSVLVSGGKLWVAVPNYELVYTEHLENYKSGKIDWEFFNSRIFGNARVAKEMYGEEELKGYPGVLSYEMAYHKAVFNGEMLVSCIKRAGFSTVTQIDKLPNKRKHPHEICVLGVK
jgi:hypothetical protein